MLLPLAMAIVAGTGLMTAGSRPAQACASEPYLGAVCPIAGEKCPQGYVLADGRTLQIQSYAALYSLLGNSFGGDFKTYFKIPDLRGRTPVGTGSATTSTGTQTVTLGQSFGAEGAALTTDNLPQHTHTATFVPGTNGGLQAVTTMQVAGVVATATTGTNVPTTTNNYIGGISGTNMWVASPQTNLVSVGGLTVSQSGTVTGAVTNLSTGGVAPIPTRAPETVVNYCIAVMGYYPTRP